jgi:WD repeat-containing protein 22
MPIVILQHYLPTIYALSDPNPIATCSGTIHPDGTPVAQNERTYSNSCTIKVCSLLDSTPLTGDVDP